VILTAGGIVGEYLGRRRQARMGVSRRGARVMVRGWRILRRRRRAATAHRDRLCRSWRHQ